MKRTCISTMNLYNGSSLFQTDLWDYNIRIFPLQVSLNCLLSSIIQFLLKPLGETPVVAQIAAGLIVGQSGLNHLKKFQTVVFPTPGGTFIVETLGNFGCMIYIFLIGVKMDLSILMRSSKKDRVIALSTLILPYLFTIPISILIHGNPSTFASFLGTKTEKLKSMNLLGFAVLSSTNSFHVISCFLTDLKILNTKLGRMATSASAISGMFSWIHLVIIYGLKYNGNGKDLIWHKFISSALAQVIFITVLLRRVVIWMIKQTPQGARVKEIYIFFIFLMVLGTAIIGELCGQHFIFGPMILGLAIPNGPPVGSYLIDKLDTLTSGLFLPLYFCSIGGKINVTNPEGYQWCMVLLFSMLGFLGKLVGTLIPCLFYHIPLDDALMLGLSLSTLGIVDVHNYKIAYSTEVIELQDFSVMVTFVMGLAGVISPIVHFFYNPSRRYIVNKKRTIQNVKENDQLRILICIHNDENVPTLVNILEASDPTEHSPITIYLLHLIELMGRSTPLLINHNRDGNQFNDPNPSDRIINCFKIFEKRYKGSIVLHPFTSITPFLSAEEDICTLALDKKTFFMIIPFHKQWSIDGVTQTSKWRNINKRVLKQAPCSVGILIDRGVLNGARSVLSTWSTYNIAIIFLGDADDREALCYGMRMGGNQNIVLTVYRFILVDYMMDDVTEKMLDESVINDYKQNNKDIERNLYKEEVVKDCVEMINVIRNMEISHDLILVGRSHNSYYTIFSGFIEWNEYPELGFFGDMLASSDLNRNASVLIIQQHSSMQTNVMRDETSYKYQTNTWK